MADGCVRDDLRVGEAFDVRELVGRDGLVMREVEAKTVGTDEGARLLHMRAEHLA